jgi:hypothetical protein
MTMYAFTDSKRSHTGVNVMFMLRPGAVIPIDSEVGIITDRTRTCRQ